MDKLKELGIDDEFGAYYDAEIVHRKEINTARSDGKKEGRKETATSIAKTMLKAGESVNKVMSYTGLKKKDIQLLSFLFIFSNISFSNFYILKSCLYSYCSIKIKSILNLKMNMRTISVTTISY